MGCSSSYEVNRTSAGSSVTTSSGRPSRRSILSSGTPIPEGQPSRRSTRFSGTSSSEVRRSRRSIRISEESSPEDRIVGDQLTLEVNFAANFFDCYSLDAKIGQGKFAEVRSLISLIGGAAHDENTNKKTKCAKLLDVWDGRGKECPVLVEVAAMEVHIAQMVAHHPNVVETFGAYKQEGSIMLVMETCDCNLDEYVKDVPDINDTTVGELAFQMLSSLHHLHALRVVHRDVKPENFLLGGPNGHTLKLCDFGLAAILPDYGMLCTPVGTAPFMPPEMYEGSWYNESADIWSLAVTIYVLLFGTFPYLSNDGTKEGMMRAIVEGVTPTFDRRMVQHSPKACKLVRALLTRNANLRPSSGQALNFPCIVAIARGRESNSQAMKCITDNDFEKPSNKLSAELELDSIQLSKRSGRSPKPSSTNSGSPVGSPRSSAPPLGQTSPSSPSSWSVDETPQCFSL